MQKENSNVNQIEKLNHQGFKSKGSKQDYQQHIRNNSNEKEKVSNKGTVVTTVIAGVIVVKRKVLVKI